ncbi:MAG: DNA mismatch repair protein MutS [uncultured Pyrinomonadaceae bacterium]|uniref:DNA mismatch repair protein MutS n=1 Tax=uncultured Pyrinomonadaceae bacterium TaxID=2283094 RepID=A0A6J4N8P1_9BACT|nr:MAG: DNA mismatch repair protein MutS [uncultured Pyrinomonadaceae bacterium]
MQNATPMLRQYLEIKKQYPGTLLFFRLGDFYELFNEDAVTGARELDITLTARHKDSPNPIPMCGVPHHAAASYISKLVKRGFRVAICEQTEEASKGVKLVKREVVRVITPGTAIDAQLVESKESVFIAAVCGAGESFGISFLELSTGEFFAAQISGADAWTKVRADIENFAPRELLYPESLTVLVENSFENPSRSDSSAAEDVVSITPKNSNKFTTTLTPLDDWLFQTEDCGMLLKRQLNVRDLSGFGLEGKAFAVRAAGACLRYARETQRASAEHISEITYLESNDFMILDAVTLKNLEIVESRREKTKHTLFNVIDQTVTGMGARLLRSWLLRPSVRRGEIQTRLAAVSELTNPIFRDKIRFLLKEVTDLERLIGRLNLGTASPRDLLALNNSLAKTPTIIQTLSDAQSLLLQVLSENIFELSEIQNLIKDSIAEEPPLNINDGGVIIKGCNAELDELRSVSEQAKQTIAGFEEREKKRSGIFNLKIKYNGVFGYFIEVSKGNLARVPADYERRQTLTNAERFTTPELKEWEAKVLGAEERIKELETEIFQSVRARVQKETKNLQSTARALATLDALASLAEVAGRRNYVAPILHDGDEIEIKDGRHAIVEVINPENFIPNDLAMNNSTDRLLIITGPNMGGKSTILRQTALIQILAQIGSFVPAAFARLPILDRIWTRVGASDDLASGRSTFMVEMTETATILHNATPRSLILLDEIGRGTSTFDGLSIAWAVAEFLHNSPEHSAKTLFATHYHELTELAENLPGAKNYQVTAMEKDGEVVFLHKLKRGKASKSYGIAVAQLAGLPAQAIARAKSVLSKLEQYELAVFSDARRNSAALDAAVGRAGKSNLASQFSLFAISNENVVDELRDLKIGEMSEKEAKDFLETLQKRII